jgi:murein DD-endopeptidase MepM/ murein hydrolase activator NlpD
MDDASKSGTMPKFVRIALWSVFLALGIALVAYSYHLRYSAEQDIVSQSASAQDDARKIQQQVTVFTDKIVPAGHPFNVLLQSLGLAPDLSARVASSAQSVFDLRRLRAGNRLSIGRSVMGELREVRYRIDADRYLHIAPKGSDFHADIQTIPSETITKGVAGEVHGSLFNAVIDAGEKPELAMRLADIFGWDLDFYTDPRPGDTFRVVVEEKILSNGDMSSYGRILMAEYDNGSHPYRAVLFHDPTGAPAYYTPDGKSMKKAFLHSPLKFQAVITSHFSNSRFHPILKQYRPHLGIDYAAPTGTPVQTIGDGRVIFAGPKGGAGNLIEIQHTNGYTTYYMHLSRILVHSGQHVEQGERIGLVGMTGLATGPHLDFRIQRGKDFVNFERLPLPPSDPISRRDMPAFVELRDAALARMPPRSTLATSVAKNSAPPTSQPSSANQ